MDEFNSIPYTVQGKLLRVLQDGTFRPLGSNTERKVNVKVITAMNIDPIDAIKKKIIRDDLFYRLSGSMIKLLPLRERHEDIELYIQHFINVFNILYEKHIKDITPNLRNFFLQYEWNGNVRELKNIIDSMVSICEEEVLSTKYLPVYLSDILNRYNSEISDKELIVLETTNNNVEEEQNAEDTETLNLIDALNQKEEELIKKAMEISNGNKNKAAFLLGIPRQTLKYKLDKIYLRKFK